MTWDISFLGRLHTGHPETGEPVSRAHSGPLYHRRIRTDLAPHDWLNLQDSNYAEFRAGNFIGDVYEVVVIYSWLQDTSNTTAYP